MISILIELVATAIDVAFLCWFVPHFLDVRINEKSYSLLWLILLFVYQVLIDNVLHVFDMVGLIGALIISICFALSLKKQHWIWSMFSALLYLIVIMMSSSLVFTVFSMFIDISSIGNSSFFNKGSLGTN